VKKDNPTWEQAKWATMYLDELQLQQDKLTLETIFRAVEMIKECTGTVWLIGNGGSAALASHMATDLQLAGVRAISLTDIAAITTYGNDYGYHRVFARQLQFAKTGDILLVISGSGNSKNILEAVGEYYHGPIIALTGYNGGEVAKSITDTEFIHINIPSQRMPIIQDLHQTVLHMICYYLMEKQ